LPRRYDPALERERTQRRLAAEEKRRQLDLRRQERARQQAHVAVRQGDADAQNDDLAERLDEIDGLIVSVLEKDLTVTFDSLKRPLQLPKFDAKGLDRPAAAPEFEKFLPRKPGFFGRLFGGKARYEQGVITGNQAYEYAVATFNATERQRLSDLATLRARYEERCVRIRGEIDAENAEIDQLAHGFAAHEPEAVARFYDAALVRDVLPDGFPSVHRVAYVPESRQLVVEREMPAVDVVPAVSTFRYIKAKDSIESSARPASQVKGLYAGLVARFTLRTLDVLARADRGEAVDTIVLSCFVNTVDPATGHQVRPCLLTVRVGITTFRGIELAKVDPTACLRGLNAQVSPSPHELRPVRPIVDFNMVDHRFIDSTDVLSTLDTRPNLAELSPGEFEALITNLFSKMGLETRLTLPSRDGGVDCVAWDMRPIVGGKVIVQAKRYKNTVGVSAVRDLYGTVLNEGAAKGILVTTSGYGKSAFDFAKNKPLELLPGTQLLFLLEEHAGIKAKIEFPDDWNDPLPDDVERGG
jgi:restriction system protein